MVSVENCSFQAAKLPPVANGFGGRVPQCQKGFNGPRFHPVKGYDATDGT